MNKTPKKHWRFQHRLSLLFVITITFFALSGAALTSWQASEKIKNELIEQGKQIVNEYARQSVLALLYGIGENAEDVSHATLAYPGVIQAGIHVADGEVLWSNISNGASDNHDQHIPQTMLENASPDDVLLIDTGHAWSFIKKVYSNPGDDYLDSPFALRDSSPKFLGYAHIVVSKKTANTIRNNLFLVNFGIMSVTAAILLMITLYLSSRLIKPLNILAWHMKRAEDGETHVHADVNGPHEVQNMSASFNSMMRELGHRAQQIKEQNRILQDDIELQKKTEHERKQLQSQLEQARKLEALGRLTGGIAHDFNNMLASIMGYAELVLMNIETIPRDKINTYITEVIKSSERARDLVGQMLVFSRKGEVTHMVINPQTAVEDALKMLHTIIPSSITMTTEYSQQLSNIICDPVQLQQVIMNLCINARDAMSGKGMLVVGVKQTTYEIPCICDSCQKPFEGEFVEISISDTGPGIDEATLQHIFDPFFTTKEVGEGTGMGLSVVHGIVHERGGHIVVQTKQGEGTTFKLVLPAVSHENESENLDNEHAGVSVDNSSGNILLADDESTITGYLQALFTSCGYHVSAYTDPRKALDEFRHHPEAFDLVILDQTMPHLTGDALATSILQIRSDVPVIICTGFSDVLDEHKAQELGIRALLHKPVNSRELLSKVQELIQKTENM